MAELVIPILVNASVVALVALAFHVVTRSTGGIADFSVGQFLIIGGLTTAMLSRGGVPVALAACSGVIAGCLVGLLNELVVIRRLVSGNARDSMLAPVVATVSLLWIWEQIARLIFGDFPLRGPAFLDGTIQIQDLSIPRHSIVVIVASLLCFLAVSYWLQLTKSGRALRAIGDNKQAAELLGFRVERSRALAFAVAGAIAGLAGILASPLAGFRALGGGYYTINGFIALFLGGAARPAGAAVGALLLETLKILVVRYLGSGYQDYVVLLIALVVFALRPQGLLPPPTARRA